MWLSLAVVAASAVGGVTAALAYRVRERARLRLVTESARALPRGGSVRYRSVGGRMNTVSEWELTIPGLTVGPSAMPSPKGRSLVKSADSEREGLYRTHVRSALHAATMAAGGSTHDGWDGVQHAYSQAWRDLSDPYHASVRNCGSWLRKVAVRHVIQAARHNARAFCRNPRRSGLGHGPRLRRRGRAFGDAATHQRRKHTNGRFLGFASAKHPSRNPARWRVPQRNLATDDSDPAPLARERSQRLTGTVGLPTVETLTQSRDRPENERRPRHKLAIETLVSTVAYPTQLVGQFPEHQRICELCRDVKSIAEISDCSPCPLASPAPTWLILPKLGYSVSSPAF